MRGHKIWLTCAALVAISTVSVTAFAQGAPGGEGGRQGRGRGGMRVSVAAIPVDVLTKTLSLTDDEKTKITPIHDKYEADLKALRPAAGAAPDPSFREKITALNEQATKDIEAVLTDEQKAKLPTILRTLGTVQQIGIPVAALSELKLTDDQHTKIMDIVKDVQEKIKALTPEDRREKSRPIYSEAHDKVIALMTDTQKTVLEKYSRGRRRAPGGAGAPSA